jgi:hypothetical protein
MQCRLVGLFSSTSQALVAYGAEVSTAEATTREAFIQSRLRGPKRPGIDVSLAVRSSCKEFEQGGVARVGTGNRAGMAPLRQQFHPRSRQAVDEKLGRGPGHQDIVPRGQC